MDLLEEARLRYPEGTVFNNTSLIGFNQDGSRKDDRTVIGRAYWFGESIMVKTKGIKKVQPYTIYTEGKWADIVQKGGESSPVNVYSIY